MLLEYGQHINYEHDDLYRLTTLRSETAYLKGVFKFEYDDVSRLIKIDPSGFSYELDYGVTPGNVPLMMVKKFDFDGVHFATDSIETDRKSYPTRMLLRYGNYHLIEYVNGNATRIFAKDSPTSEPYLWVDVQYDNKHNWKGRAFGLQMFEFLFYNFYYTAFSRNNVVMLRVHSSTGEVHTTYRIEYEYNDNGYPVKETKKLFYASNPDPENVFVVEYTYRCE